MKARTIDHAKEESLAQSRRLRVMPVTLKKAVPFVAKVHRRLPNIQGAMWAVGLMEGGELRGVAVVGSPARVWNCDTLNLLRVAVMEGTPNGCSMLYGAVSRAAKAMGADNCVTYTHADESGTTLRAAGWVDSGLTDGGEWNRDSRQRALAVDPNSKRRWFTPWSKRARASTPDTETK